MSDLMSKKDWDDAIQEEQRARRKVNLVIWIIAAILFGFSALVFGTIGALFYFALR